MSLFVAPVFFLLGGVSSAFVLLRFLTSEHELSLSASALLLFRVSAFCRCLLIVFSVSLLLLLLFCFSALLLFCFPKNQRLVVFRSTPEIYSISRHTAPRLHAGFPNNVGHAL